MKKTAKVFINIFIFLILISPLMGMAANDAPDTGLIPCTTDCGFNDLVKLVNKFITFVLFDLAVPVAAICFAYAGFLLVTSGGSPEKKTKAKGIFTNVAVGLIFAIAAWLIVNTILVILGYQDLGFIF